MERWSELALGIKFLFVHMQFYLLNGGRNEGGLVAM